MMAAEFSKSVESLRNSTDKTGSLTQLKILLSSLSPTTVSEAITTVSFNVIFDCLNTENSEQIDVCCDLLDILLEAVDVTIVLHQFHSEVLVGLGHPVTNAKHLCIKQVLRAAVSCGQQLTQFADVVMAVLALVMDDNPQTSQKAAKVIVNLAQAPGGLEFLAEGDAFQYLKNSMDKGDVIRYRVYELVVDVAKLSPEALQCCHQAGLLDRLVNEVNKDDVLVQLNSLELLAALAMCQHGLTYLEQSGTVTRLNNMMDNIDAELFAALLMPGLIRFFGSVAYYYPKELTGGLQHFIYVVFSGLDSSDMSLKGVSAETLGHIGSTTDGKLALEKHGNRMTVACKRMWDLTVNAQSELKTKALNAVTNLLHVEIADQTADLESLTESWFSHLGSKPLEFIMTTARQPFAHVRSSALHFMSVLSLLPWGQRNLTNHPGFNEYLLDRSTENTKEGKEEKYQVVRTLVESPTAMDIFGRVYFVKLKQYFLEGPFYVQAETSVAFESGT